MAKGFISTYQLLQFQKFKGRNQHVLKLTTRSPKENNFDEYPPNS
jgi:hypothetical protein